MTVETRLGRVLERLASGVRAHGIREQDAARAERNGDVQARQVQLAAAVDQLEAANDALWKALESR